MEYLDRAVQWAEECDLEVPFWKLAGTKKLIGHCECLNSAGPQQSPSRVGCIQFPEWCFWFPWCFFSRNGVFSSRECVCGSHKGVSGSHGVSGSRLGVLGFHQFDEAGSEKPCSITTPGCY